MLTDDFGREVSYLRLSVTDRCNLSCFYCRIAKNFKYIPHNHLLTYEELLELADLAGEMGVGKVRLTGGEPLVRRDFLKFLERLAQRMPGMDVRLTTNGTLLSGKVRALKDIGLRVLNVSLDTLDDEKYEAITGQDKYYAVREALDEALAAGLEIKLNAVAMRGINDDELGAFIGLARDLGVDVRFIEFMPIGDKTRWDLKYMWPADEILAAARNHADLEPVIGNGRTDGPARIWRIAGSRGRLGLISALSHHFCDRCNRLRVTPDGRLRTCLFSDKEYRLLPLMRSRNLGREALVRVIEAAVRNKPMGYKLLQEMNENSVCHRAMTSIGG